MLVSIPRLRRWIAAALIFVCALVTLAYFYGRHRVKNALRQVPGKIGLEIQQSAQGFTISKSEQGRTLFKIQANKAVQFKSGGHVELHDVAITLYGRDSSRFDQVYGKDFEYDPQSGEVTGQGEVQIDLQSNPEGLLSSDQTPPKELKNPIHLKTTGLVFNKNSGDAWTPAEIDFSVPQANGSAVGAKYVAHTGVLTLESQVKVKMSGEKPGNLVAERAVLEKDPRQIILWAPRTESGGRRANADEMTLFLRDDNTLDRAIANGHVLMESSGRGIAVAQNGNTAPQTSTVTGDELTVLMNAANRVRSALLSGNVHLQNQGVHSSEAWAGRAEASFTGLNLLSRIHAENNVRLLQKAAQREGEPQPTMPKAQDVEITAPAMTFLVADGRRLTHAETEGSPQITLLPTDSKSGQTRITADKFTAAFDTLGQLSHVHGEARARAVTSEAPRNGVPQPDRVSTSDTIDAFFRPGTGIESITQQGHFAYAAGTQQAFADSARYASVNQTVVLTGSPRMTDAGMETTADRLSLNRSTGTAKAEGNVKTTYNQLKPQAGGALLASSDPIHVSAQNMTALRAPASATYRGNARLWQNANIVEAPVIEFQKDQRTVTADSDSGHHVSTSLFTVDPSGRPTPINVTASHVVYRDGERKAHYEGGVTVRSSDLTITANQMDVFFAPKGEAPVVSESNVPAKLDRIVASGSVIVTQPTRHANGEQLTYTASDDKFVLTGGPPSIFDAERGKITGVSLTLFRHDDRVVVEGNSRSPAVAKTRMER